MQEARSPFGHSLDLRPDGRIGICGDVEHVQRKVRELMILDRRQLIGDVFRKVVARDGRAFDHEAIHDREDDADE